MMRSRDRRIRCSAAAVVFLLVCTLASCRSSGAQQTTDKTQVQFGVRMARMNLWREAMFRFQRAVQTNPGDAMAHNNLAVAYEANGDFDNAAKEYREAMRLDKSNQYIQKNYSRFVEFTTRGKRRQQKTTPAPKTATTNATTPAAAPAPPPPDVTAAQPAPALPPADQPAPAAAQPAAPPATPPPSTPPSTPPPTNPPNGGTR